MKVLTFTLVMDGASDRILVPIVEWLLSEKMGLRPFSVRIAEGLPAWHNGLASRIRFANVMYPNDVLLIHRDSENHSWVERVGQISLAVAEAGVANWIPIVPVRMSEAWFLFDEQAIRRAAGNSASRLKLRLPSRARWSLEVDPKEVLFAAIREASGHTGRKLQKLHVHSARARVADLIEDFSYLRGIPSFDELETSLDRVLAATAEVGGK
jgi:hypothetical protein